MVASQPVLIQNQPTTAAQHEFLVLLPQLELHARIYFRDVRCAASKADKVAETVALAWRWYLRLLARRRSVHGFSGRFIRFAARAVKCGRRVCGQESSKDAFSTTCRLRRGLVVTRLADYDGSGDNPLSEALAENRRTPPDEQAAFRIDFREWLQSRTDRDRRIVNDLMMGERALDVSRRHGVSAARISQLRRAFQCDWCSFCGEIDEGEGIRPN